MFELKQFCYVVFVILIPNCKHLESIQGIFYMINQYEKIKVGDISEKAY